MKYKGIIFDLDGVVVSTDNCHYLAWKQLADEENICFDKEINERLRGVSRMESLDIILENSHKNYTEDEKLQMTARKNGYYVKMIGKLSKDALLPGAVDFIKEAKKHGIKIAIGSSSKNTMLILKQIEGIELFDAIADGNDIKRSKPAPDVFLKAAEKLGLNPDECMVIEDADAGVEAALAAGMDVLAVGFAMNNAKSTYSAQNLQEAYNDFFISSLDKEKFLDKVHGCWYGKCLGGAAGAPLEGIKKLIDVADFTDVFNPDLPNDDLDLQLLWLDVLEEKGFEINSCDLADAWIKKCWYPFSEYGYFMKNYMRGIKPPYSGIVNNSFYKEGMGCPIRSEIWGIICAGKPELATEYAYMDGSLDHADNAIYAEQFLAAVEAMAFYESDIDTLIEKGMKLIPNESKLHKCFDMILSMRNQPWQSVRQIVLNKFGHPDFTNCVQNLGFVLIALFYGNGDMRDTINIALRCGYDTDCTCASAASIVGIIKGYSGLGDLCELINDYFVCGIDVQRPSDSIKRLAEDSVALAEKMPETVNLKLDYPTEEGLQNEIRSIESVKWKIYGPYFEQLNQPINPEYPSPHGEGCVLPDLVCMVNNEVLLDKEYEKGESAYTIEAYEDFIEIDKYITMEGQYACFAETYVVSNEDKEVWAVIGNNDGFMLSVNSGMVLEKDEIRLWTPQNNFCLIELKKGVNKIELKLLRRTENLKFSIGLRNYDGCHWHKSKWCTDLKYVEVLQK